MMSDLGVARKLGKKSFFELQFMYTMFPYLPVSFWNSPARPRMTLESINACASSYVHELEA